MGGVSMMVTGSTISFLCTLDAGLFTSRTTCVMPALKPANAVRCGGNTDESRGNAPILPRPPLLVQRFFGRNCSEPWRGASNLRCDISAHGAARERTLPCPPTTPTCTRRSGALCLGWRPHAEREDFRGGKKKRRAARSTPRRAPRGLSQALARMSRDKRAA